MARGKGKNVLGIVGAVAIQTALTLAAIYALRKVPYVGPWVDTALKG